MIEHTIDAEPTFVPWYAGTIILPKDAVTAERRALRAFARQCRRDRILGNIAASPSRSMFVWPVEIVRTVHA